MTASDRASQKYGAITNLVWEDEAKWMRTYTVPAGIAMVWTNSATGKPTGKIYINKDAIPALGQALKNISDRNLLQELRTFDGCFNIRDVRGVPGQLSAHAYGLAIDLNAADNGLRQTPKLSPEFVKCWTDAGWTWGGNFQRLDGMHFQYGWG